MNGVDGGLWSDRAERGGMGEDAPAVTAARGGAAGVAAGRQRSGPAGSGRRRGTEGGAARGDVRRPPVLLASHAPAVPW